MKKRDEYRRMKWRGLCLGCAAASLLFCAGCGAKVSGAREVEVEKPPRAEETGRGGLRISDGRIPSGGRVFSDGRIPSGGRVFSDGRIPSDARIPSDGQPGEAPGRPIPDNVEKEKPEGRGERPGDMPEPPAGRGERPEGMPEPPEGRGERPEGMPDGLGAMPGAMPPPGAQ